MQCGWVVGRRFWARDPRTRPLWSVTQASVACLHCSGRRIRSSGPLLPRPRLIHFSLHSFAFLCCHPPECLHKRILLHLSLCRSLNCIALAVPSLSPSSCCDLLLLPLLLVSFLVPLTGPVAVSQGRPAGGQGPRITYHIARASKQHISSVF